MAIFLSNMALSMLDASCDLFPILRPLVTSLVSFSHITLPTTYLNSVECHFPIQHGTPHVGCLLSICFLLCGLWSRFWLDSTTDLNAVDGHFPIQHGTPNVGCFLSSVFFFAAFGHVSG